jgi:Rieske Fe-S protein
MDRKEFIIKTCAACIGAASFSTVLSSCAATQFSSGRLTADGILIDAREFAIKGKRKYLSYLIVRNEALLFPICVYRFNENDYSALWMQCQHQGAELNVAGDYLQCPAHGSEYNNRGGVTNGPADRDLRTFRVTVNKNELFIDLRKT